MRSEQEQQVAALCHLFNIIPLWGLLINGGIWFHLREESRKVVIHAYQAMIFHAMMLGVVLIYFVVWLLTKIIHSISERLAVMITQLNETIIWVLLIIYLVICLYGCIQCYRGRPFRYPLIRTPS